MIKILVKPRLAAQENYLVEAKNLEAGFSKFLEKEKRLEQDIQEIKPVDDNPNKIKVMLRITSKLNESYTLEIVSAKHQQWSNIVDKYSSNINNDTN